MSTDHRSLTGKIRRGSALIMVVFTLFLVMLTLTAIYVASRQNLLNANDKYWGDKAGFGARAGIEFAIGVLASNPYICAEDPSRIPDDYTGDTLAPTALVTDYPLEGDPDVTFDVEMRNNNTPDPILVEGVSVPSKVTWVRSRGSVRDRAANQASSLVRLVGPQTPMFKQAVVGLDRILVDSTSSIKAWNNPTDVVPPTGGPQVLSTPPRRGDLATNSTSPSAIVVNGVAWGLARAGVGTLPAALNSVITGSSAPTEGKVVAQEAVRVPRFILDASVPESFPFKLALSGPDPAIVPAPPQEFAYRPLRRLGTDDVDIATTLPAGGHIVNATAGDKVCPAGIGGTVTQPLPPEHREGAAVPAPGSPNELTYIFPGRYDLTDENGGSVWIEDAIFRRNSPYYFKGNVTLAGRICSDPGYNDDTGSKGATVIYINGNLTIQDGAVINFDRYDLERDPTTDLVITPSDGLLDEPLPARNFQVYTLMNSSADTTPRVIQIGQGGAQRPKVSMVCCGPRMEITLNNALYYGGIQGYKVDITNHSDFFFDTALYGVPLDGQGETSVLMSTVIRYGGGTVAGGSTTTTSGY